MSRRGPEAGGAARAALDDALRAAVEAGRVPGAVGAVTDRHGTRYLAAYGAADAVGREPLCADSVFRLASMTKIPTSLAVLQLVDAGLVALDAPLSDYVPGYVQPPVIASFDGASGAYRTRPANHAVTIRQLLTHTSGYGYWFLDAPLLRETGGAAATLTDPPFLMYEPGERFAYGTSTDVLALLIEPVTGVPLAEYLRDRLFAPLGMDDTGYEPPVDAVRLVKLHRRDGTRFAAAANERHGAAPQGGTGLYGTAEDYLRLLRLLLNGGRAGDRTLVAPRLVAAMTRGQVGSLPVLRQKTVLPARTNDFLFMDGTQTFGFGVLVETRDRPGARRAGSYGWGGIFNTYFWVDPSAGLGAVLMMQMAPFCDPSCIELLDRFERAVYAQAFPRQGGV